MLETLREEVLEANLELVRAGLVTLTWGNVSGLDRERSLMVIKPSGVAYDRLTADQMVILDLDGNTVEGELNPSSDTPTHLLLYRTFEAIGGIAHTHSVHATAFAQACLPLPCLGTTHADHFHGEVPLARALTQEEVDRGYEHHTGVVIAEAFARRSPIETPAVLAAHHGPFTWGRGAAEAVKNSIALETCSRMALATLSLNADIQAIPGHILEKHYTRKHGPDATYGQR